MAFIELKELVRNNVEETSNGLLYEANIRKFLIPTLNPSDIVIMNNLISYKVSGARELLIGVGCELIYLSSTLRT